MRQKTSIFTLMTIDKIAKIWYKFTLSFECRLIETGNFWPLWPKVSGFESSTIWRSRMTREQFAQKIRWQFIVWLAGFVNVIAMLPQLVRLLTERKTDGISLQMFYIYLAIQVAFCFDGYFKRNKVFFVCMGLSALLTTTNIVTVIVLRH
jgi:uncharacterized protein with PQ loop repeat